MSDYISLADLKAMDIEKLNRRWSNSIFPFEMARCRACVTMHRTRGCSEHEHFVRAASILPEFFVSCIDLHQNLEAIYSLRLFFKDLYANNPPEIMQPVASVEVAEVRA